MKFIEKFCKGSCIFSNCFKITSAENLFVIVPFPQQLSLMDVTEDVVFKTL